MPFNHLPKIELHCHLLGVISPVLLRAIQQSGDEILVDPDQLAAIYPIRTLADFQRWVDVLKPYQADALSALRPVLKAHLDRLKAQRVVYAELMISPTMFPRDRTALLRACQAWRDWATHCEDGQIQVEFLMVLPRILADKIVEHDTETFIALHRAGLIAGVALVGLETGNSIRRFAPAFRRLHDAGLGIEIHAGEHSGPLAIREALDFGQADRLGHALSLFDDGELLAEVRERGIHLEFCPTSNLRTGCVSDLRDHVIQRARQLDLSYSVSTDDPGAFQCNLDGEYQALADSLGFTESDFKTMYQHARAASFQPRGGIPP